MSIIMMEKRNIVEVIKDTKIYKNIHLIYKKAGEGEQENKEYVRHSK